MGKNFRCPLCGSMVSPTRLDNFYPIDIFVMHGLGKGRGFSFEKVEDSSLFDKIKIEIKNLYARFFIIEKTAVISGQLAPLPKKTIRGFTVPSVPIANGSIIVLKGVKINGC